MLASTRERRASDVYFMIIVCVDIVDRFGIKDQIRSESKCGVYPSRLLGIRVHKPILCLNKAPVFPGPELYFSGLAGGAFDVTPLVTSNLALILK